MIWLSFGIKFKKQYIYFTRTFLFVFHPNVNYSQVEAKKKTYFTKPPKYDFVVTSCAASKDYLERECASSFLFILYFM